jgi:agmatine/peptidylarginine deiminase
MKATTSTLRFPAEWEKQDAILLSWPHAGTDWQPILREIIPTYVQLTKTILRHERLIILCTSIAEVEAVLGPDIDRSRLHFRELSFNDTWVRDYGPLSILSDGRPCLLDFTFNGWGMKFAAELDNQTTRQLYDSGLFSPQTTHREITDLVLEGGSIDTDGQGTLLTTTTCLLAPHRNGFTDTTAIETLLALHLGVQRVLWLQHGRLDGDDTDGHIDTLARFCDPETIAYVHCADPADSHFIELQQMEMELKTFRTPTNKPYRLIPLPLPPATYDAGERLPATYANFLIINDAVLMPTYHAPTDSIALTRLQAAFPDRRIEPVNALPLIKQHGSIHCSAMQIPFNFINL